MNRRNFLKLCTFATGNFIVTACEGEKMMNDLYQNVQLPPFSATNLHTLLNELLDAYEAKGMKVSNDLLPPINEQELREICSWFPGELPAEIIALYAWRGGHKKDAWEADFPFWFRDNSFCSIERAKQEYQSMMDSYGTIPEDHELLKYSFPFASFNGGCYVLPTQGQPFSSALSLPIISVLEGIDILFYSIESMVSTCIEWVKHPQYDEDYSLPKEIEIEIWQKHNPGIFKY